MNSAHLVPFLSRFAWFGIVMLLLYHLMFFYKIEMVVPIFVKGAFSQCARFLLSENITVWGYNVFVIGAEIEK